MNTQSGNKMGRRALLAAAFAAMTFSTASIASAQIGIYIYNPEHRRAVDATLNDLQAIEARNTMNHKQQERYDHALLHLQRFAEKLHERGQFDKGKLDQAIGDVQDVIDHNPMDPGAHERLIHDVTELRRLRQHYEDRNYRYPY